MAGPVTGYNVAQGASAALIGPSRSRLRTVNIYAEAAGSFTMTNGSSGATMVVQKFPVGMNELYIPDDGMIFTNGVYLSAFTGSNNELTIFLS
tara:strand:+ start:109 stop:387 length:279 start_codon:yes stop_codon:yes gene_type:complete